MGKIKKKGVTPLQNWETGHDEVSIWWLSFKVKSVRLLLCITKLPLGHVITTLRQPKCLETDPHRILEYRDVVFLPLKECSKSSQTMAAYQVSSWSLHSYWDDNRRSFCQKRVLTVDPKGSTRGLLAVRTQRAGTGRRETSQPSTRAGSEEQFWRSSCSNCRGEALRNAHLPIKDPDLRGEILHSCLKVNQSLSNGSANCNT